MGTPVKRLIAFNSNVYGRQFCGPNEIWPEGPAEPGRTEMEANGAPKLRFQQKIVFSEVI
jgi:hypothetical protein